MKKYLLLSILLLVMTGSSCQKSNTEEEHTVTSSNFSQSEESKSASLTEEKDFSAEVEALRSKYPDVIASVRNTKDYSAGRKIKYFIDLDFDSESAADAYRNIKEVLGDQAEISWFRSSAVTTWTDEDISRIRKDMVFDYDLNKIGELLKLGNIEEAKTEAAPIDESVIEEEMQRFLTNNPPIVVSEKKKVEDDDLLMISYCIRDEKEIYDKAERVTVKCGKILSDSIIDSSVKGREVGETYIIEYPLEKRYAVQPGTYAECEIKILYIYTLSEAKLDDSYAKDYAGYPSVEEWREALRNEARIRNRQIAWADVVKKLAAASEFRINSEELINRSTEFAFGVKIRAELLGMTEEEYIRILTGDSAEDYIKWAYGQCEKEVHEILIVEALAKKMGYSVSEKELEEACKAADVVFSDLNEKEKDKWRYYLLLDKVAGYMVSDQEDHLPEK